MNLSSSVLCVLVSAGTIFGAASATPQRAIVGGVTAEPGAFPYFASFDSGCAGALIAPDIVLTLAFCYYMDPDAVFGDNVFIGAYEWNSTAQGAAKRKCAAWINHPDYNVSDIFSSSDVALCKLDEPVTIDDSLVSVEVNADNSFPLVGTNVIAMGLGSELPHNPFGAFDLYFSDILQNVTLPIIDNAQCLTLLQEQFDTFEQATGMEVPVAISEQQICSMFAAGGKDTCYFDDGAPLVVRNYVGGGKFKDTIVGLRSFGYGCALPDTPTVNTRVSSLFDWITTTACDTMGSVGSVCNPNTDAPTDAPTAAPTKSSKKTKSPKKTKKPKKTKSPKRL